MKKASPVNLEDLPLEGLLLQFKEEKYKVSYAAIRWAKELKQKENLADAIPTLLPRALREILSGKVSFKDIEKLPMNIKVTPPPAPVQVVPSHPTITLNTTESEEEDKE